MLAFREPSLGTTRPLRFEDVYVSAEPLTLENLRQLSSYRQAALSAPPGARPPAEVAADLEKYLGMLENLVAKLAQSSGGALEIKQKLSVTWSSPLGGSSSSSKQVAHATDHLHNIRFEQAMSMNHFAAVLREVGSAALYAGDLVSAARHFRRAAGVYDRLRLDLLPTLQLGLGSGGERPAEVMPAMAEALKQMALGEGQAVAARGSETKVSPALRAKLLAAAAAFFANAAAVLQDHAADFTRVTPKLKVYLQLAEKLNVARAYRALAADARGNEQAGVGIACLRHARDILKAGFNQADDERDWALVWVQEQSLVASELEKLEKENQLVYYQAVAHELPPLERKPIVAPLPYDVPVMQHNLFIL